jgi:hypothetical protein
MVHFTERMTPQEILPVQLMCGQGESKSVDLDQTFKENDRRSRTLPTDARGQRIGLLIIQGSSGLWQKKR